jgi:hypothetical protein
MPTHAVIWIDHKEARVFHVYPEAIEATRVLAPQHHLHRHPDGVDALLIVGPSSAKLEFFRYLHEHDRPLEAKVVGVESADHPTDGEIVARAKSYFVASDRMS